MLASRSLNRIERTSAADQVRSQLLALIESGELAVGARLPSEHELARSFGVSRAVVREGVSTLRSVGIVESRPGAGTYVRSVRAVHGGLLLAGRYSTDELHEIRRHIEIPGAGLAALRRTDTHARRLEEIVKRHAETDDVEAWLRDDLLFHVTLAEATGNALQVRFVTELHELRSELTRAMARMAGELAAPLDEHAAILDAVRRRDEEGARRTMADHLDAIRSRYERLDT